MLRQLQKSYLSNSHLWNHAHQITVGQTQATMFRNSFTFNE